MVPEAEANDIRSQAGKEEGENRWLSTWMNANAWNEWYTPQAENVQKIIEETLENGKKPD